MSAPDRISLVLKAPEGGSLEQVLHFTKLGAHVSIGRGLAVIAGASQGDLQAYMEEKAQELGHEREVHSQAMEYCERALGMHPLLASHAREMHDLLQLINVKVGGLRAICDHGGDPSDEMWEQFDQALDQIWPLLEALPPGLADRPVPITAFSIDEHVKLVADARRYRRLRDRVCIDAPEHDVLVMQGGTVIGGGDLDRAIDQELRQQAQGMQDQQP
ncbi:hypothetical protein [Pseudomonas kermanshahensis]|uniref:hypothetical protein n=1 Tax=Pseudomonas kermanshahensis TaxID=2745482 RepID=UPI002092B87A|nr:hypothetical protein [Pseudomonas kermanshahensis]USS54884.1 hypothetical protein NG836_24355 [Pseudomonas kermanshahensis]